MEQLCHYTFIKQKTQWCHLTEWACVCQCVHVCVIHSNEYSPASLKRCSLLFSQRKTDRIQREGKEGGRRNEKNQWRARPIWSQMLCRHKCVYVDVCAFAASSSWHEKQHSSCTKSFYVLVCSSVITFNSFTSKIPSELRKDTEQPCVCSKTLTLEISANNSTHKTCAFKLWRTLSHQWFPVGTTWENSFIHPSVVLGWTHSASV